MESSKERMKPVMLQERVSEQKAGEHPQKPREVVSGKARLPGAAVHLGGCLANLGSGLVWCLYVTLRTIFKSFFVHIRPLLALKGIRVSGAAVQQPSGDRHDSPGKKKMFL